MTEPELETIFDSESLAALAEDFYAENGDCGEAKLRSFNSKMLNLTIFEHDILGKEVTFSVYIFNDSDEVYRAMDQKYRDILRNNSSGSEFWDQWNAVKAVLELKHLIVQETFSV